jgi:hypothetical protein
MACNYRRHVNNVMVVLLLFYNKNLLCSSATSTGANLINTLDTDVPRSTTTFVNDNIY